MKEKDRRTVETIIGYCDRLTQHLESCDNDREIFMSNILYKDACALVIIQIGEFVGGCLMNFMKNMMILNGVNLKV